ncbi:MAG: manganese efflux pump [Candidatus Eremiobacteraeota bacterium]|nr:manganese efflux pump [Candidatus Eremiobacteraeota bacterium]
MLPLGLDTMALSIALGLRNVRPWRPALVFAVFEGAMPIIGIGLARSFGLRFGLAAGLIGGLILVGVGIYAVREALADGEEAERLAFGSLRSSLLAGLAISTDEVAIGFPLGASGLPVGLVLALISLQAFVVTVLGISIGGRIGATVGGRASRGCGIAAGVAFVLLGLWLGAEALHRR